MIKTILVRGLLILFMIGIFAFLYIFFETWEELALEAENSSNPNVKTNNSSTVTQGEDLNSVSDYGDQLGGPKINDSNPNPANKLESDSSLASATNKIKNKDMEGAAVELDNILRKDPNNASALSLRGMVYLDKKKYAEALESHNKAISLEPGNGSFYMSRALGHMLQGDIEKMEEDFQISEKLSPELKTQNDVIRKQVKVVTDAMKKNSERN